MPPVSSSVKQVSLYLCTRECCAHNSCLRRSHATVDKHFKRTVVAVRRVGMSTELDLLLVRQLQVVLEALADLFQPLLAGLTVCLALLDLGSLLTALLRRLASRTCPETHTPEGLTDVDHDTHNLVVAFVLQSLADGSEHHIEPGGVLSLAVLERVGPAATELVLRVLPFRAHAALEEVVVRLLGKLRGRGDVVLEQAHVSLVHFCMVCLEGHTYVDAPELLDGSVQVFCSACLTLKLDGSSNTVMILPSSALLSLVASVARPRPWWMVYRCRVFAVEDRSLKAGWGDMSTHVAEKVLLVDRCDFAPGRVGAGEQVKWSEISPARDSPMLARKGQYLDAHPLISRQRYHIQYPVFTDKRDRSQLKSHVPTKAAFREPKICSRLETMNFQMLHLRPPKPFKATLDTSPSRHQTARTIALIASRDLQAPGVTTLSRSVRRLPRSISSVQMTSVSISTTPTLSSPDITLHRLVSYLGTLIATGLLGLCLQTRKMNHGYQVPICVMKLKL
ncbi:hypothetical protein KC360_g179 [Hortaea werneckii]|nr:hypothetical protein KC360_g179 [Hortaea werneckii]